MDAIVNSNNAVTTTLDPHARNDYQYQPLNPTTSEIRILTLQPIDNLESDLELTISHVSLQATGYCALSYTWGDPKNRKEIRLNGQKFQVNANLPEALKALASHIDNPLAIWADAICINQNDLDERAEQVKVMRDIFANADSVIAWIGKREEDDELGYMIMNGIAQRLKRDEPAQRPIVKFSEGTMEWLMQSLENADLERCWNALSRILHRPWWSRAWIVQEVAVSNKAFLMCGNLLMEFTNVFRACALIYMYEGLTMDGYGKATADQHHHWRGLAFLKYRDLWGATNKIAMLSTEHAYQKYRTLIGTTASGEEFEAKSGLPILTFSETLYRFSNKQSTDPRDKIYAYMGLAMSKEETGRIQVDYKMRLPKLYRQVVRAHLEVHRNLKIFDWFSGVDRPDSFSSWAHALTPSTPPPDVLEVKELQIKWNAAVDIPAQFKFLGDDGEDLALQGLQFDRIDSVGEKFFEPQLVGPERPSSDSGDQPRHNVYKAWQELAGIRSSMKSITEPTDTARAPTLEQRIKDYTTMWRNASHSSGHYPTGQWALDAFVQTILMDPHKADEYCEVHMDRCPTLAANRRANPFSIVLAGQALLHRRFFITVGGYFGLGPKTVARGDKVCVLFGAATPYVLRDRGDHHIVVGWSYIHGLMSGEAIQKMKDGELREETFLLR